MKLEQEKPSQKILSCFDVANYFLVLVNREAGDSITQLKLQKLVYFAQGTSLALLGKPLFEEEIEAWEHGPVTRILRKTFGNFKDGAIPAPIEIDFDLYSEQEKQLIFKVYSTFGEHSAYYLRNLTHTHSIWRQALLTEEKIIDKHQLESFFKKIVDHHFLAISKESIWRIIEAEDEWWMNYDCGVQSENITDKILQSAKELKAQNKIESEKINDHLV